MSLQAAAQHLAAHGRGKDTELVHMDKGELASLEQLARMHGGSLSTNPKTGLPEAGFLSAILPMVAAAAGTINGGHISCDVDTGGTISGAANALRATVGGTTAAPGGTLAAIQADTNFGSGVTLPGSAAFIRFTESGSAKMSNLFNVPAAMVLNKTGTNSKVMKIVDDAGNAYYIMLATTVS